MMRQYSQVVHEVFGWWFALDGFLAPVRDLVARFLPACRSGFRFPTFEIGHSCFLLLLPRIPLLLPPATPPFQLPLLRLDGV